MTATLHARIAQGLAQDVTPAVRQFGEQLGREAGAMAVLFYGSNLRTGSLEGVLDFYLLLPGEPERGLWPRVSYHERRLGDLDLRAKAATMTLAKFTEAALGLSLDTTVWARFVQPSALVWHAGEEGKASATTAIVAATVTAARLAAALGPRSGDEGEFWLVLFRATYRAEFRIETSDRARSLLELNRSHFDGLLPLALEAAGIAYDRQGAQITPRVPDQARRRLLRWWTRRRRLGKLLNLLRLVRATSTFDGAARYAAWKIERHTGIPVELTPWRERHPVLAAPGVMFSVWRSKRRK